NFDLSDATNPAVGEILRHVHAFTGTEARLEIVNRIKLWRYLTGDDTFDVDYWMGRMTPRD
ncbi:MAG TPA: phytanoyl-CoA dioxygenase, partial [Polyangia bacterium]|nr:phytanoyl-CoA dioxygenase [Polyangia bacterium]